MTRDTPQEADRENSRDTKKIHAPFSRYLLFSMILITLIVATGITIVDYHQAKDTYESYALSMQQQTEQDLSESIRIVDTGFKVYDEALNIRMEHAFENFSAEYERAGHDPSGMDLEKVKQDLGGVMDLYIINESMMIEYTTFPPDLGLDFSQWSFSYNYLKNIIDKDGFFPDRVVKEVSTGDIRKFAYMPSSDHRYIFELGLVEKEMDQRGSMEYREPLLAIAHHNPYIISIRAYDTVGREIGTGTPVDPGIRPVLDQVIAERRTVEIANPESRNKTRYLFVDTSDQNYASDTSWILELTYDTSGISAALNRLLFFHGMVAFVAILLSVGLAMVASRQLSKPVQQIVNDIETVEQGDLNHTISSRYAREFDQIAQSMNTLVGKLKGMIDRLRESEEELRKSEERYRTVVESQTEMIARFLPDGTHVFANEVYCRFFGRSCDEIIGKIFRPRIPPEDQEDLNRYHASLTPDNPDGAIEHRVIASDNEIRWVQWYDRAIFDPDGRLLEIQSVGRDITGRKQIEASLIESERRFRDLATLLPQVIFETDLSGNITYVNVPAYEMFGYTDEDLRLGLSIWDVIVPDQHLRAMMNFQEVIQGETIEDSEYTLSRSDGSTFEGMVYSSPIIRDDVAIGIRGILIDITELKRAAEDIRRLNEELEQRVADRTKELEIANRELEAFSYSVSHDLRAPLRAIDGFSFLILNEYYNQLDPAGREYLERIRLNAQKMGNLIDAILNFSRMSRQPLQKQQIVPARIVKEVLNELLPLQKDRKIDISMGILPPCNGDPILIKQVFHNLLSNALKFTRTRENARIEIGSYRDEGRTVYFVRDNGVGFNMEYADKLFSVFQRLHDEKDYEGTGIGLAIAHRIIQRHGGRIWGEGKVGEGATFFFTLED
jgi:PAS domain S-box-containing protein